MSETTMEDSYGSTSTTRRRQFREGVANRVCRCGNNLKLCTSWTNQNPGRRYLVCCTETGRKICSFFEWFDPPMCSRSKMIIPGLLRRINKNEQEIKRLSAQLEEIQSRRVEPAAMKNMYIGSLVLVGLFLVLIGIVVCVYIVEASGSTRLKMLSYNLN